MPKYAVQPHWRQRRIAIGRKGAMEAELVTESELVDIVGNGKSAIDLPDKRVYDPSSPISVASGFADMESMPEMKPITLPNAWVIVGKGGRPLKNTKMYEEPKKKKKKRSRKPAAEADSAFGALHDLPSSSTAYRQHDVAAMRHEKEVAHGKEVKFWVRYQKTKATKKLARDALLATLLSDLIDDEGDDNAAAPSPSQRRRDVAAKRHVKETRRCARRAAAAARCGAFFDAGEDDDGPSALTAGHPPSQATLRRSKERAKTPAGASGTVEYGSHRSTVAQQAERPAGAGFDSPLSDPQPSTAWTRRPSKGRNCSVM